MYVAPADFADRPGATEIAQVATPARAAVVDAGLMLATLESTDRSAWTAPEIAVADEALEAVNAAIADAESVIDGYIAARYALPLINTPRVLTVCARAIARYLLHKDRRSMESDDPIVRDYRDATRMLEAIAKGTLSLGANDPSLTDGAGDVQFTSDDTVFGRDQMKSFR